MITYTSHNIKWMKGVSEPVRQLIEALEERNAKLMAERDELLKALEWAEHALGAWHRGAHADDYYRERDEVTEAINKHKDKT